MTRAFALLAIAATVGLTLATGSRAAAADIVQQTAKFTFDCCGRTPVHREETFTGELAVEAELDPDGRITTHVVVNSFHATEHADYTPSGPSGIGAPLSCHYDVAWDFSGAPEHASISPGDTAASLQVDVQAPLTSSSEKLEDPLCVSALPFPPSDSFSIQALAQITRDSRGEITGLDFDSFDRTTSSGTVRQVGTTGLVHVALKDADGDGLPDSWETNGVDVDGNGTIDLDLPAMGADPRHKDIFVELDHMVGHEISDAALEVVVHSFAAAPVANPDGTTGITLHVDNGSGSLMDPRTGAGWGSLSQAEAIPEVNPLGVVGANGDYDWTAFQALETSHFSSLRRPAFHYAVSVHDFDPSHLSGLSRNAAATQEGASDFLISLGGICSADPCTPKLGVQAGTFMHELGHNLGLGHGGTDDDNYKPNYLSIMNYAFQLSGVHTGTGSGLFDYSRYGAGALPPLDETNLDEASGLTPADPGLTGFLTLWQCPVKGVVQLGPIDSPIDWDCNLELHALGNTAADVNGDGKFTTLQPAEDWHRLVFMGGGIGSLGAPVLPMTTPNIEAPLAELLADARALDPADFGGGDTTRPATAANGSPAANATGWNNSDVTVSLSASDEGGSGVQEIVYSLGGTQTVVAGSTASVQIGAEGVTTLSYFARDNAGNEEQAKTLDVKIDKTKPTVAYSGNRGSYTVDQSISIRCTAADGLSGLASPGCADIVGPASSFPVGLSTVSATVADRAGNTGTGSTSFTVAVTPGGLCLLSKQFVQSSLKYLALPPVLRAAIDALATALCRKLDAVVPLLKPAQKAALIAAYKSSVAALASLGWLTPAQAATLNSLASTL